MIRASNPPLTTAISEGWANHLVILRYLRSYSLCTGSNDGNETRQTHQAALLLKTVRWARKCHELPKWKSLLTTVIWNWSDVIESLQETTHSWSFIDGISFLLSERSTGLILAMIEIRDAHSKAIFEPSILNFSNIDKFKCTSIFEGKVRITSKFDYFFLFATVVFHSLLRFFSR